MSPDPICCPSDANTNNSLSLSVNDLAYLAIRIDEVRDRIASARGPYWKTGFKAGKFILQINQSRVRIMNDVDSLRVCGIIGLFEFSSVFFDGLPTLRQLPKMIYTLLFDGVNTVSNSRIKEQQSLLKLCMLSNFRLTGSLPALNRLMRDVLLTADGILDFFVHAWRHFDQSCDRNIHHPNGDIQWLIDTINCTPDMDDAYHMTHMHLRHFSDRQAHKLPATASREQYDEFLVAMSRFTNSVTWLTYITSLKQDDWHLGTRIELPAVFDVPYNQTTPHSPRIISHALKLCKRSCFTDVCTAVAPAYFPAGVLELVLEYSISYPESVNLCMERTRNRYTEAHVTRYMGAFNTVNLQDLDSIFTPDLVRMVVGYMIPLADTMFVPWHKTLEPMPLQRPLNPAFVATSAPATATRQGTTWESGRVGFMKRECVGADHNRLQKEKEDDGDFFMVIDAEDYPHSMTVIVPSIRKAAGIHSPIELGLDRSVIGNNPAQDDDFCVSPRRLYAPIVIYSRSSGYSLEDIVTFSLANDTAIVDRPLSSEFVSAYVAPMSTSWIKRNMHTRHRKASITALL